MEQKGVQEFSKRAKIFTTIAIYFGNICLAIGMNAYSPVVVDFTKKFQASVDEVAIVFTILTITFMVGALLTGFIYNFLKRQLGVILGLIGISAALILTPFSPTLKFLYAIAGLLGLCNGLYNASQVVWVIEMWQPNPGPLIQGQDFFYALGALVPSILLGPFLINKAPVDMATNSSTNSPIPYKNELIWIPFTTVGALTGIVAIIQIYLFAFHRYTPPTCTESVEAITENRGEKGGSSEVEKSENHQESMNPRILKLILIVVSAISFGFYQSLEMVSMQFISTFAQFGNQNMTESEGANVMTALTGSFAIARGIGIFANMKIPAQFMLIFNLLTLFVSCAVLITTGNSAVGLWFGVALLGIGLSTIYPSLCTYVSRHLEFTNAIGSLMLVCGSIIASIFPIIIGKQIENKPIVLIYANLFCTTLIATATLIILKLTYNRLPVKL